MDRRGASALAHLYKARGKRLQTGFPVDPGSDQKPAARRRGERDRNLEFGIIVAAGTVEGIRPAVVEDVFSLRMAFQISWHRSQNSACFVFQKHMSWQPASRICSTSRFFQRIKKVMRKKRVKGLIFRKRFNFRSKKGSKFGSG